MSNAVFIGTFDPYHGGHIGQLMRAYTLVQFTKVFILVDKNPEHKPNASDWRDRLELARLAMAEFEAPFDYEIIAVENSLGSEITEHVDCKITGIDSFIDNLSDQSRWKFISKWPMVILSIPGFDDSLLEKRLDLAPEQIRNKIHYTFVRETDVPNMNYDFSTKTLGARRIHSTQIRSGGDTPFIPLAASNYIHRHGMYSSSPKG